ncbi:hypothetical protein N7495_004275 [Penicillium taxi]|uniref:uncharacterized protein n=1 Tax=Penicillium taxi TaxID=168475 RepID=UPI00254573D2|nr:uncharacterized protein N7495_004275 [Penicillium taxi]KAJ5899531.1 hypothetical protein N7495_004275 [Penicillium taxi]
MAFNFGTSTSSGGSPSAELGPELSDVFTDEIGFKGISGDTNIRFLPTPWPENALPSPTCSLLAVAQTNGLVVGAGPDVLVIGTTDSVRKAISAPGDKAKTRSFQPQVTIPLSARPTHVAFTANDEALILASENGSQISVFQTSTLLQGNAQPAVSVPTNGASIRALVPNPDPNSSLVALVTANGELLVADLKAGNLVSGANGPVLKTGVSSVAWSNKGKQLVAGLADGTADQMTPDGVVKAQVPRPSDLQSESHVSSIAWLENDVFFIVYTPNALEDDMGQNPDSSYYIITRRKQAPFLIQKLPDLCSTMGFGMKRTPAYQFIARLRDYKPYLKDVLIVSSTSSADVGLVTRSEQPLASDDASKALVGQFTTTEVGDDSKRANIPLKESADETSVIGLAIDLSATEPVIAPIPGADIQESSTPLPGLLLLNNDGVLCSWWFIYSEAIRQKVPYASLAAGDNNAMGLSQNQSSVTAPATQQPAFGQPAFGAPSPFGKPAAAPSFGSPSAMGATAFPSTQAPAFGTPSQIGGIGAPAFGTPSAPGPSFGTPSFGKPSQPGAAFGSTSTPGQPSFGKPSFGTAASPFGQPPAAKSLLASGTGLSGFSGGFSSFATAKPVLLTKPDQPAFAATSGTSMLASQPQTGSPFGGKSQSSSPFGGTSQSISPFSTSSSQKPSDVKSPFGTGNSGFVLGSAFKPDGSAADNRPQSDNDKVKSENAATGAFALGKLGDSMSTSTLTSRPDSEAMDDAEDSGVSAPPAKIESKSPFGAPSMFGTSRTSSPAGSLFGNISATQTTTPQPNSQTSIQSQIGSPLSAPSEKTVTPMKETSISSNSLFPEAPLPPDPSSRDIYAAGDTSASSNVSKSSMDDAPLPPDPYFNKNPPPEVDDAPLPPDFMSKESVPKSEDHDVPLPVDSTPKPENTQTDDPPVLVSDGSDLESEVSDVSENEDEDLGPAPDSDVDSEQDDHESDFSDSGEEITHDESKIPSPGPSAESSFSVSSSKTPTRGLFGGISKATAQPRKLFGEIGSKQPLLPPPEPVTKIGLDAYQSPSPTRVTSQKNPLFGNKTDKSKAGDALFARKASLTQNAQLRKASNTAQEEQARRLAAQRRQQEEEEALALSDDDDDENLRADLARPVEPVSTLDPFLPHQNYMGDTTKPGIPGMIERLYRDVNSMIDTLGINARSLQSFIMYQDSQSSNFDNILSILQSEEPANVLDEEVFLQDIRKLEDIVPVLSVSLQEGRVQGVEEKLEQCRELITKDILHLRGQCASIRKTLDAHTDANAILLAPLSAEQAALQLDLRTTLLELQGQMADLEQGVSMLRAKLADMPRPDGSSSGSRKRPTVEAVTSTIATMMHMAESKSSDIDVLEAQMRKLGVDISATTPSREGSPFTTPRKSIAHFPNTPDGSAYHTPESASRGVNFRTSVNGSAKPSRLRSVEGIDAIAVHEESARWKVKSKRRELLIGNVKAAIEKKERKVRTVDDL